MNGIVGSPDGSGYKYCSGAPLPSAELLETGKIFRVGNIFCQFPNPNDPVGGGRDFSSSAQMTDLHAMYVEAESLKDDQQYDKAIAKLNELLAKDDSHVLSHLALAVLYGRVNDHEKAVSHGKRACELDPQDAFGFTALSVTFQRAWQGTQRQEYIHLAEEAMAQAHALQ